MSSRQTSITNITRRNASEAEHCSDLLAMEEPLEIRLSYCEGTEAICKNVSVTMRTPGNDAELAAGFLFTEGIIKSYDDIAQIDHVNILCAENKNNTIQVALKSGVMPNLHNADRNFYTTS